MTVKKTLNYTTAATIQTRARGWYGLGGEVQRRRETTRAIRNVVTRRDGELPLSVSLSLCLSVSRDGGIFDIIV